MPFALPSVTSDTVSLTRFTDWFRSYARVPLRYVIGQPGAGKTTAVAIWAQQQKVDNVAWISLRAGTDDAELVALLGEVIEDPRAPRPLTIVLDDIDRASASARSLLAELYLRAPENLQFIYVARAFNAVDVIEGEQRGVVAVAGGTQMRFGAEDIALFCEVMGVPFGHRDCAQLELATDGWAFAVTGAVRVAKAFGLSASDALERWRSTQARSVERIVAEALKVAPARDAQDLLDIVEGRAEAAPATLRRLARGGLFVSASEGAFAVNPIVAGRRTTCLDAASPGSPLVLDMFGRFRVVHDGVEVRFLRRRDAQIVQYLALQPQGRATRAELIRTFWPDADPQLGAQGLRTACSAIRRALAARVGRQNVDRYLFSAPAQIGLRFDAVVSSMHRFVVHAELAVAAEARGASSTALAHWTAALQLYTAPVLSGEPFAWWIEERAAAFEILRQRGRRFMREASGAGAVS